MTQLTTTERLTPTTQRLAQATEAAFELVKKFIETYPGVSDFTASGNTCWFRVYGRRCAATCSRFTGLIELTATWFGGFFGNRKRDFHKPFYYKLDAPVAESAAKFVECWQQFLDRTV